MELSADHEPDNSANLNVGEKNFVFTMASIYLAVIVIFLTVLASSSDDIEKVDFESEFVAFQKAVAGDFILTIFLQFSTLSYGIFFASRSCLF